ncbi:MAG: 16S rRNA (guanine(966)-N(2))-methyltransferase RsmD [Flavobacteriaceae bacterium]|jgi:16S rRNA (guanine(966)-N(2))-methyltransferase RsmD|nr:16S rRNA (guanine(966)-N(2))-methyltransferase RsmD [Flavobacteriaceae bacterium]
MRIISGIYKGRRLKVPKNLPVRPTTDMAKEALFNILMHRFDFQDLSVLDLFSGTGNIAYEFCSRGTPSVLAIDKEFRCTKFIETTATEFEMPIDVRKSDVFSFLERTTQSFDIIFADPPYAMEIENFESIVSLVFKKQRLNSDGLLIIEHSKHTDLSELTQFDEVKTYGGNCFSFFK